MQTSIARSYSDWSQFNYEDTKAEDLLKTYSEESSLITVTVWFENYQYEFDQNVQNQYVRATLNKVICENHPGVVYTEADLSNYNLYAAELEDFAGQLNVNLKDLYDGPVVLIMYDLSGTALSYPRDSYKLVVNVDEYLHQLEKRAYGVTNGPSDIKMLSKKDLAALDAAFNHYHEYLPYYDINQYSPSSRTTQQTYLKQVRKICLFYTI